MFEFILNANSSVKLVKQKVTEGRLSARSLKSTHTAHMCGGPKKVGRTKKLVD